MAIASCSCKNSYEHVPTHVLNLGLYVYMMHPIFHLANFIVFLFNRCAFVVAGVGELGGQQVFFVFEFKYVISFPLIELFYFLYSDT